MKHFEEQRAKLALRFREKMQDRIVNFMRESKKPYCVQLLADEMQLRVGVVDHALSDLVVSGRVVHVGRDADGNNTYRAAVIGSCEWCGTLDHRIVAGECPDCAKKSINFSSPRA